MWINWGRKEEHSPIHTSSLITPHLIREKTMAFSQTNTAHCIGFHFSPPSIININIFYLKDENNLY